MTINLSATKLELYYASLLKQSKKEESDRLKHKF